MGRRYLFLTKDSIESCLDYLRDAFLAAEDGHDVDAIIDFILTSDEKTRIARRIQIAFWLINGFKYDEIIQELKTSPRTISDVDKNLLLYKNGFHLISKKRKKINKSYEQKKFRQRGSSLKIKKWKERTEFNRKDVKR